MKHAVNWTWTLALVLFAVFAGVVVWWPLPDPPPPEPLPAIPATRASAPAPDMESMLLYTVQSGDTPESIAKLFVVHLDDLLAANHLPPSGDFEPDQRIHIPMPREP